MGASGLRLARRLIGLASVLVPAGQRRDWHAEWAAELAALADWPARHRRPIRRALGAFADAFWLRQRSVADLEWIDEARLGARQLWLHGGGGLAAAGILALGLGATITMFSVTTQVLLRPLPYPDADRVVTVWETRAPDEDPLEVAPANFLDWRERAQSFEHLAGVEPWSLDVVGDPRPEVWFAGKVTPGFFETFGVTPVLGRFFTPDEYAKGRDGVLVIGERFWRQRFAADPAIIGRVVSTDDASLTIVGIAPASFEPRLLATAAGFRDVWQPKAIEQYEPRIRGSGYWAVVGRLKPDVSVAAAQAEMQAVSQRLAADYPQTNEKTGARVLPLRDHLVGNVRLAVTLLGGAVALVLLIACVNVANLLLAHGSSREREMAVRYALGAHRWRIVRQLLIESTVVAAAGATGGALLASWALAALARFGPRDVPWIETLHLDWPTLAVVVVLTGVVALLSGLLPAWRVARVSLASAGRLTSTADPAQHRLRAALVVAEIALALTLVTGATLLIRSFVNLLGVDTGFQRDRVLVAQVFAWDYNPSPAHLRTFFDSTIARLTALPAVQYAGAVSAMPFIESNINIEGPIAISGRPAVTEGEAPRAFLTVATPGYFDAMRIPLLRGRGLSAADGPDTLPVAVISETLARRYWPDDDPIGDKVRLRMNGQPTEVEIVGVVASLRHDSLDRGVRDELFLPLAQRPFGSMTFVIRSASDATSLLEPARAAIWSVNPSQTVYRSATLDELVRKTVSARQFALAVIVGFAGLAVLLSIAGVYSVLSAIMTTRMREVGVRVALGASRWDIARLVLARGLGMAVAGLILGLAGSLGAAQLLRAFLFNTAPTDPGAVSAAAAVMLLAALGACYRPASRAATADPVTVLRTE